MCEVPECCTRAWEHFVSGYAVLFEERFLIPECVAVNGRASHGINNDTLSSPTGRAGHGINTARVEGFNSQSASTGRAWH